MDIFIEINNKNIILVNQGVFKLLVYPYFLKTTNRRTWESNFKIFEKLLIYFGILEKFNWI